MKLNVLAFIGKLDVTKWKMTFRPGGRGSNDDNEYMYTSIDRSIDPVGIEH